MERKPISDKLQHEMYWNRLAKDEIAEIPAINYNMRCIETGGWCFVVKGKER